MKNYIYLGIATAVVGIALWIVFNTSNSVSERRAEVGKAPASTSGFWSAVTSFFSRPADSARGNSTQESSRVAGAPLPPKPLLVSQLRANNHAAENFETSSSSGKRPDFLGGEEATANVSLGGAQYPLTPNQGGDFGRIIIDAKARAQVQVTYPQAQPNDTIQIEAEDGGVLDTKSVVKTGTLDNSRQFAFAFQSGIQAGIYRVTLRQGSDLKQIDFWVGPELSVRQ